MLTPITGKFKVGDRVLTVRYHGGSELEPATVLELRTYDYVIRYDRAGNATNGDYQTVGRSERNLEALA